MEMGLGGVIWDGMNDCNEEIIKHANKAFFYWEDHEIEKAREHLRISAAARYQYSMGKYASLLYHDFIVEKKQHDQKDLFYITDLLLMGAIRSDEYSSTCLEEYFRLESIEKYLYDMLEVLPSIIIQQWLRGEYVEYPPELQAFIQRWVDVMIQ
jgi:hypothetical protein